MGIFDSPEAPAAPNPTATAAAQTGTNVSTAIANSYLGNQNQVTPQGNLTFDVKDNFNYTDPTTGQSFNIPRWTSTQTLNPTAQAAFDQGQSAQLNLAQMANQQSGSIKNLLATPFNTSSAPAAADMSGLNSVSGAAQSLDNFGPQSATQTNYASGGDITKDYGPADNFSADRQRVEQAMFERVNPQIQQQEQQLRQQLADQGIRYGSGAYGAAYDPFNRGVTDTRLGIVAAGGAEQQRMTQMAQQRAQFQNQAQAQAESQNAARAAFGNQAAQQQFGQAGARAQLYNQGAAQNLGQAQTIFNAQNQLRNQSLQEQYQLRNQPLNEITALLSGSQVSAPNFINAQKNSIPTTDVAGLINQNFAQQNDLFKTQTSSWNDLMGGIIGGGSKLLTSDVRVKENIAPMGSVYSAKGELPIYEYDYKGEFDDGRRHVGPMAQDVEKLEPRAVKTIGGVKHINRDKLGSIFGSK